VIVLDASVLIAHLEHSDAHHTSATELLLSVRDEPFGVSSITLAEVLVEPSRKGLAADTVTAVDQLGVTEFPLPPSAPELLAQLRAETALKLPDCCVLLTAEMVVGRVLTLDGRLGDVAARRGLR
jgi:predicted nucleic acid-binding protein